MQKKSETNAHKIEYIWVKATGGGAYKFADLFKERLGISIEKEDEMNCLVSGANFLLKVRLSFIVLNWLHRDSIDVARCCNHNTLIPKFMLLIFYIPIQPSHTLS